jgi:hypothetical protein
MHVAAGEVAEIGAVEGEVELDLRGQLKVAPGDVTSGDRELDRLGEAASPAVQQPEHPQRSRAQWPVGNLGDRLFEQRLRPLETAGVELKLGRGEQPLGLSVVAVRREANRELRQLRCFLRRAPRPRPRRRHVELPGHRRIGAVRCEREMTGPLLQAAHEPRQPEVDSPPPRGRRRLADRGRKERMPELDPPVPPDSHDPRLLGRIKRLSPDELRPQHTDAGRGQQRLARLRGQPSEPRTHQRLQISRNRQPLRCGGLAEPRELTRDLDRVERVAAARCNDSDQ